MGIWALSSGELRHPVEQVFFWGGGEGVGIGGWAWEKSQALNTSFHSSLPTVSPERSSYGTSSSSSKRTEGGCRRSQQSRSSSDVEQGQWETGEPSPVGAPAVSLSPF